MFSLAEIAAQYEDNAYARRYDQDGRRVEVVCIACGMTDKVYGYERILRCPKCDGEREER